MRTARTRFSCKVQAVVTWYAPSENFLTMDEQLAQSGTGTPDHSAEDSPEVKTAWAKDQRCPGNGQICQPDDLY